MRPFKNGKTVQDARKTRRASTVAGSLLAVNDQDGTQRNEVFRSRFSVLIEELVIKCPNTLPFFLVVYADNNIQLA